MHRLIELDERILTPQLPADFVVGDDRASATDQQHEQLEWLGLQAATTSAPAKFPGRGIQLELAETERLGGHGWHRGRRNGADDLIMNLRR